jgi:tetratricopeptide (TPR) repeat protein
LGLGDRREGIQARDSAKSLNPGYATAHHWYAWHLIVMGQDREGIAELRKAENLDPLSLIISADLADALCISRLYDESVRQSRKTLEMDPNFTIAHYELGRLSNKNGCSMKQSGSFKEPSSCPEAMRYLKPILPTHTPPQGVRKKR